VPSVQIQSLTNVDEHSVYLVMSYFCS
jgi:hypothetical protein